MTFKSYWVVFASRIRLETVFEQEARDYVKTLEAEGYYAMVKEIHR